MSQLFTASSPAMASNRIPRTIEITIHRCPASGVFIRKTLGFIERKRDYFVNIRIGNESRQTSKRPGGNGPVEWNEKFIFHNVEKSTLTLALYYDRLFDPKLVSELTIPLPETQGDVSPSLSRTATFRDGPQIQWTLCVKDSKLQPEDASENRAGQLAAIRINVQDKVESHELPDMVTTNDNEGQDADTQMRRPEIGGSKGHHEELEAVEQAKQALDSQSTIKASWKQALEKVQAFKEIAGAFAEAHPFAKLACTIFFAITEPLINQLERDENMRALLTSLVNFCNVLGDSKSDLYENERLRGVLKRASLQITDIAFFVRDCCKDKGFVTKAVKNMVSSVDDEIQEYCSKLDQLKDELRTRLAVETEIKIVRVLKVVEDIAHSINLDDIAYVAGAGLDTDKMCLDGTRVEVLEEIMEWVSLDDSESRIMWLCGGAGTGKSAIAHTIAARFEQMGRLGSIFCFSETDKAARKPASLFPHVARDLADLDANIRHELYKAVQNKADRTTSGITTQFTKLILAPANAIRENLHGPIVIVIDALDESGTVEERSALLQVLGSRLRELPPNFRVIITSRPDLDIQVEFSNEPHLFVKRMHTISAKSTSNDIATFVRQKLAKVPNVDDDMCQMLAFHARGLFQWAKVACQFIRNPRLGESPQERYERLTRPLVGEGGDEINGDTLLDYLYHTVLEKVISPAEKTAMERFRFVMAWVLTALEPLSCNSLNQLFMKSSAAPKNCKAENVVMYLGSLLTGVDDQDAPIRPLHTSFRDFLTNPDRSREFFVRASNSDVHLDMTLASLYVMKAGLRFNICQLPTSHLANKDIPGIEIMVKKYIPPYLSYSCRFWAAHLRSIAIANPSSTSNIDVRASAERCNTVTKEVHELLLNRVLYWLEVLSLLGASNTGLQQIRHIDLLAKARNMNGKYLSSIQDLERFWSYFAKCIATSAAHIYISALPFAPTDSLVAKNHLKSYNKTLSVVVGQLQNYPSCLNILHGHTRYIFSVACSPDGTRIISGSDDNTVRVWNAESGETLIGPLIGHTGAVNSVAFSPDGERIASGSDDNTILVWNAERGEIVLGPLRGHIDWVYSVAFSPDGTLITSGSGDSTIRLWNAETGEAILGPLEGHTALVRSVAFSPKGTLIASGSEDMTIRIWSVDNGKIVLAPLTGHTNGVWSVAFSPDGTCIASGSCDNTIRIWSTETGEMALGPLEGHTGFISSVAFSPSGTRLVSTSCDATIRVWNTKNGQMVLGPLEGHTGYVLSAVFSSDGTRLISGSYDNTIRVWNTENEQIDLKPLEGHTDAVMSVFPSPDGTRIFSTSFDKTIRVSKMKDGEKILGLLKLYTDSIFCASLSPDGTCIAFGSNDSTVFTWSVESCEMLLGPLEGHDDTVWSIGFSSDGSRIVSGSVDTTIRVWNSENGDLVLGPLKGHTNTLKSVSFSPDNSCIVSGSFDGSIRVWNATNGEAILGPLEGHIAIFSPKGTSIVSGSSDGTIRMWSAKSGKMTHGPLKGHTHSIDALAFSSDGSQFVSGSYDGTIRLWHGESGQLILGPLAGHANGVRSVAFSPDGDRIISGSFDASVRVWNVGSTGVGIAKVADEMSLSVHADLTHTGLPKNGWRMRDGWALGENDELLFYVPPPHQLSLWGPRTELIISRHPTTKLNLSRFVHGTRWAECFDSGADSDTP